MIAALPLFAFTACSTNEEIAIVNSTDQTLVVTVDQRPAFSVEAGRTVKTRLPALQQLTPITITARDERGATVFSQSTSVTRLVENGRRLELVAKADMTADPDMAAPTSR